MSQDSWFLLLLKIVLIADLAGIIVFVADYTRLTRGAWARHEIGRTIVIKDVLLFFVVGMTTLSVFLHFNRLTSRVAGWIDLAFLAAIAVSMFWRTWVFERI